MTADIIGLIVAEIGLDAGVKTVGRFGGDKIDQPGGGVAAVQRPLRPFQHLDALQIHHRTGVHDRIGIGDLVDIGADRRGGREVDRVEADAAQGIGRHPLIALRHGKAGGDRGQVAQVGDAQIFQRRAIDRLDRHADVVHRFRAALGSDDDLAPGGHRICSDLLGSKGRGGQSQRRRGARGQKNTKCFHHSSSLKRLVAGLVFVRACGQPDAGQGQNCGVSHKLASVAG